MGTCPFLYKGSLEITFTVPLALKLNSPEDPTLNLGNLATPAGFLRYFQHVSSQRMSKLFFSILALFVYPVM